MGEHNNRDEKENSQVDHTAKRRAVLAMCMDVMARAISDEDASETWLADGVPDGTLTDKTHQLLEAAAADYEAEIASGMTQDEWEDLCKCWAYVMARGCFGWGAETKALRYERGSLS